MARVVLDIFLSSTSEDLRDYRRPVAEVVERLRQATLRMESFGAKPGAPLDTCREEVQRCDVLVVVVGHRYGWIPSEVEGGDGVKSITWWEVAWALAADKPVYAFLIDPQAPWVGAREQDALLTAASEAEALAVWRAVQSLRRFRAFLDQRTTRATFASPDHLASLVATSLTDLVVEHQVRQAKAEVAHAPLPTPVAHRKAERRRAESGFAVDRDQAAVVGSDIIIFDASISTEQRKDIANAMLLAQLVADQRTGDIADLEGIQAWHSEYVDVLTNLGFTVASDVAIPTGPAPEPDAAAAIRAAATTQLGHSPATHARLIATLESLVSMPTEDRAIALFHRESASASGARFQLIVVEQSDADQLRVRLLGFGLMAGRTISAVLFHRFRRNDAIMVAHSVDTTVDGRFLAELSEALATKLEGRSDQIEVFDL